MMQLSRGPRIPKKRGLPYKINAVTVAEFASIWRSSTRPRFSPFTILMTSLQRSSSSVHTTVHHLCNRICKILRILSQKQFKNDGTNQIQSHYNCCCDAHYVQYLFRHQSGNFGKQRAKQIQKQNAADAKTNRRGKSNSCLKIECIVCIGLPWPASSCPFQQIADRQFNQCGNCPTTQKNQNRSCPTYTP